MGVNVSRLEQLPLGPVLANRLSAVTIGLHATGDLKASTLEADIEAPCASEQREDLHGRPTAQAWAVSWVSEASVGLGVTMPHHLISDPQDERPAEAPHRGALA